MRYRDIKSNGDIDQVIHNGEVLWEKVIKIMPIIGKGDRSNRILIDIDVPKNKKIFTKIHINYEEIYSMDCVDLEFKLSDYRFFGWKINTAGYASSYGSSDGVTGSPVTEIELHSLDEPISNIKINAIFNRSVTEADIENIKVTGEYVMEE